MQELNPKNTYHRERGPNEARGGGEGRDPQGVDGGGEGWDPLQAGVCSMGWDPLEAGEKAGIL